MAKKKKKAAKKQPAKKHAAKKKAVKKPAAKKQVSKKKSVNKPALKKQPAKKPVAKKVPAKKPAAKKPATSNDLAEKNVCSNSWSGLAGETLLLKNPHSTMVTVSEVSAATWPFSTPASPFNVPDSGSAPGTTQVTLKNAAGNYEYNTSGCPGDPRAVNPKTVIIS